MWIIRLLREGRKRNGSLTALLSRLFSLENKHKTIQNIAGREVCVYSISCKNQTNIDLTLQWLTKHAKT